MISEALALTVDDIAGGYLTLRKRTTKGKKATRTIPINAKLNALLVTYLREESPKEWLFPSHHNAKTPKQMTRAAADLILNLEISDQQVIEAVNVIGSKADPDEVPARTTRGGVESIY